MWNTLKERIREGATSTSKEVWTRYEKSFRGTTKEIAPVPIAKERCEQSQVQT